MANTFKNYSGEATTSGAQVYTVASGTTSILMGGNLANKTGTSVDVSVQIGSGAASDPYIIKDAPVPSGSALGFIDGKIIVEENQIVTVTAGTNSAVDVILSVLEQS